MGDILEWAKKRWKLPVKEKILIKKKENLYE